MSKQELERLAQLLGRQIILIDRIAYKPPCDYDKLELIDTLKDYKDQSDKIFERLV